MKQLDCRDAAGEIAAGNLDARQIVARTALAEGLARGLGRRIGRLAAVGHGGCFGCQRDLRRVDLLALERFQPAISSSGRSVNMRRNRPTSASDVSRQYCQ